MAPSIGEHADYGLDAPQVVRNLFIAGVIGLLIWGTATVGLWSGRLIIPIAGMEISIALDTTGLGCAVGFLAMGIWMVWSSKVGKIKERESLLQQITWNGNEHVLDLGCGRGLMLIGAAKRLTTGKAIGIDIWQSEDLSGNRPEAALENARREGVEQRVEIKTADMRRLPFADNSFDVVVSRAAIHNLYSARERAKAIGEVARVLKPGGQAIIDDIRHHRDYATTFAQHNCTDIKRIGSRVLSMFLAILTFGALCPATLLARKAR